MIAYLTRSSQYGKRYSVNIDGRIVHFGSRFHQNYTMHKDDERKERYKKRHYKRENWNDPYTAGFWSRWLLWNKKTLSQSIENIYDRFGIKVVINNK